MWHSYAITSATNDLSADLNRLLWLSGGFNAINLLPKKPLYVLLASYWHRYADEIFVLGWNMLAVHWQSVNRVLMGSSVSMANLLLVAIATLPSVCEIEIYSETFNGSFWNHDNNRYHILGHHLTAGFIWESPFFFFLVQHWLLLVA